MGKDRGTWGMHGAYLWVRGNMSGALGMCRRGGVCIECIHEGIEEARHVGVELQVSGIV